MGHILPERDSPFNNSFGYSLGNEAIKNNWNEEELLNNVINAANNGKLYMLK